MKRSKSHSANIQTIVGLRFIIDGHEIITLEKLDEDIYSSIYTCVDTTGAIHILKIIQTNDKEFLASAMRGIVIHSNLGKHYNVLRLEGYATSDMSVQVLMEYCDNSLINEMTRAANKGFSTEKIVEIFSSVLAATKFIHSQDPPIIHRGITPKNILCQKGVWKLCYFRTATTRVYHTDDDNDRRLACDDISQNTNPVYRAPEMVDLYRGEIIDTKSDIWCLGCLLYSLCTLKDAFPEGKSLPILNGKYKWDQPWDVDEYFKNIVARCLNPNPQVRPTAAELDEQLRTHFTLGPTPEAPEKAVRMVEKTHHTENSSNIQMQMQASLHAYSARLNQPQIGFPIIQTNRPSQPRTNKSHVHLDYYSYTKALLNVLPPDDEMSDESDIEVVEEKKDINRIERDNNNSEKFDKEMDELNLDNEEEEENAVHGDNETKKKRRPSVIQLSTTIENLIEFGDETTASVKNTVDKFNIDQDHNSNNLIQYDNHHHKSNNVVEHNNNNNVFNTMNNSSNHNVFNTMDNNHDHNVFNTIGTNNQNVFNTIDNSNHFRNNNNNNSFNTANNNVFNTMNRTNNNSNNNVFDTMNTNNNNKNVFNTVNNNSDNDNIALNTTPKMNKSDNNGEIFKAFDNYNKTKNIQNDILGLDISNNSAFNSYYSNNPNQQIEMKNKVSFSTGNMNKMNTSNNMLDSSDSVDDLFKNATLTNTPDYKNMYLTNPEQLKITLLKLDNLSLSTALYKFMSTDDTSYYILGLAREAGMNGTRILCHIPALAPSSMNNYLQQRKQFLINFPLFEGNFSLYDFTQQNKGNPPPTPGTPPCSVDVAIQLLKVLDLFLKAFAEHQRATILIEDGYDAFQTLSYIIAKLKFFKIQQGFVDSSIIPLYNNLHRRILDAFTKAQLNINFPLQPFNFEDEQIVRKLRAPKHRDIYEQTQ